MKTYRIIVSHTVSCIKTVEAKSQDKAWAIARKLKSPLNSFKPAEPCDGWFTKHVEEVEYETKVPS